MSVSMALTFWMWLLFITLGLLKGRVVVIVHTEQADVIRIISVRKATKYEEITYFEQIAN
ncbi:MAG: BrnT family toxin [Nitrososphaera sp.]|nr:BrnT family toxin [Nitrososphaera sp.]